MVEQEPILQIDNLSIKYVLEDSTVDAVNGISMKLHTNKVIGLVGETGAGKTTTALAVLNLVPNPPGVIVSGDIRVCGYNMRKLKNSELEKIRGRIVSMVFQDPMTSLNPVFTVGEQIAEVVILHENLSRKKALKKARDLLKLVGIPAERSMEYPHQFSGGMRQRVGIAIALACNPKLVILDEPTTALDVTIQAQILDMLCRLKSEYGTSLLLITHDLGIVAEICDEIAVMYAGKIVESGTLYEVFKNTKHPYTEGLFNSLPDISKRGEELKPIPGLMPDPSNLPIGCAFEPRCPYAIESCKNPIVFRKFFSNTHSVLCSAYDEPTFYLKRRTK